jgi:hypothetical protein
VKTVCAAAVLRLATALVGLFFTSGHASPPAGQLDIKSIDAPDATSACNRVPFALGSTIIDRLACRVRRQFVQ